MEQGERALLNFGHTIGHALEKAKNFALYHGECVALGCVAYKEAKFPVILVTVVVHIFYSVISSSLK